MHIVTRHTAQYYEIVLLELRPPPSGSYSMPFVYTVSLIHKPHSAQNAHLSFFLLISLIFAGSARTGSGTKFRRLSRKQILPRIR